MRRIKLLFPGLTLLIAFALALPATLAAQPAADGYPSITLYGEARATPSLYRSEESAAMLLAGEGDFLLGEERASSGEVGGITLEIPLEFNRGYSGISIGAGYAARDLRFDAPPFRGGEYPGNRWLTRELLIQEGIFLESDFAAYDLPPAYPELYLPQAVPLQDFRFENLAERRYNQYLLDSTGMPLLSEIWHLPIQEKVFHLEEAYAELQAYHVVTGSLFVFGSLTPSAGREQNSPARNGATFREGYLGAGMVLSDTLTIGIGGAYTEDFGAPAVLPWLFVTWEPVDWFELEINVPDSFSLNFYPTEALRMSLGLDYSGGGYGLRRRGAADARDQLFVTSADAYLGLGYDINDTVAVELRAGATVFEEIELWRRGSLLYKYEGESGAFARFALTIALVPEVQDDFE